MRERLERIETTSAKKREVALATMEEAGIEKILEPDFTISLSDESDDGHICRIVSCHGSQQRALSHSAAAKDADTLSETAGKETVNGPNPGRQRLLDMLALHRPRGSANRS